MFKTCEVSVRCESGVRGRGVESAGRELYRLQPLRQRFLCRNNNTDGSYYNSEELGIGEMVAFSIL